MELAIAIGVGLLCGGLSVWLRRRNWRPATAPQGTKPQVLLEVDDVTYDVTDQLYRVRDSDKGFARWLIFGPQHVVLKQDVTVTFAMRHPVPRNTLVEVMLVRDDQPTGRFATFEEMAKAWPEITQ